jgi:hypothetical protein
LAVSTDHLTRSTRPSFLPFSRPSITAADIAAVAEVLESGWITTGKKCAERGPIRGSGAVPHAIA